MEYEKLRKKAWMIYYLLAVVIACILVLFVASDIEEQFFYGIMTIGAAWAFRPTPAAMDRKIEKFTGTSKPDDVE